MDRFISSMEMISFAFFANNIIFVKSNGKGKRRRRRRILVYQHMSSNKRIILVSSNFATMMTQKKSFSSSMTDEDNKQLSLISIYPILSNRIIAMLSSVHSTFFLSSFSFLIIDKRRQNLKTDCDLRNVVFYDFFR